MNKSKNKGECKMPEITLLGVPEVTSREVLSTLRTDLIATVEREMGIKPGITRVFFPPDMLGNPDEGQDDLLWGFLYTGMFEGKPKKQAKSTTAAIAKTIKAAFGGKLGVEVFIQNCDASTKTLLKPD